MEGNILLSQRYIENHRKVIRLMQVLMKWKHYIRCAAKHV